MELTANYSRISYLTLEDYFRRGGFRGGELRSRLAGWSNPSLLEGGENWFEGFRRVKRISIFTSIRSWISHRYRLPNIRSESCEQLIVVLGRNHCQNCENQ